LQGRFSLCAGKVVLRKRWRKNSFSLQEQRRAAPILVRNLYRTAPAAMLQGRFSLYTEKMCAGKAA
ncbi:MAG TPA: hypothetical protein DCR98_07905, partial [Cobetia sp.]|nr:hypothetical protein [Cobetia sp.]